MFMKHISGLALLAIFPAFTSSCNYTVSMSHTSGGSTETMEDSASANPNIAPNLNIPLK